MTSISKRKNQQEHIPAEDLKTPKLPKREKIEGTKESNKVRIIILLGYSGYGYHGIQINNPLKTIEGDVVAVLKKLGYLKTNNIDAEHLCIARAARTDKGVHTLRNLISLNLFVDKPLDISLLKTELNEALCSQIRVWSVFPAPKYFNPRISCESRTYEYLIPSFALLPPKPSCPLFKKMQKNLSRKLDNELERNLVYSMNDLISFWNTVKLKQKEIQEMFDTNKDAFTNPFKGMFFEKPIPAGIVIPPQAKLKKALKQAEYYCYMNYRIKEDRLKVLQQLLKKYEGRHNFHNFTVTDDSTSPSNYRYIESVTCGTPFVYENWEWIPVTIKGNSFMLNQIRKMMAHVLMIIRSCAPTGLIDKAFDPNITMNISKSPGHVLLLKDIKFSSYNDSVTDGLEKIQFNCFEEDILSLKVKTIYPDIIKLEQKEKL
ncbi:tRNA pseudouridine synthase Pus2 [Schizosaccharomyces pombe]